MFVLLLTRSMQLFIGINSSKLMYIAALTHLQKFMEDKKLPRSTEDRIKEYYKYVFHNRFFDEPEILSTLSLNIRQEHRMHLCRQLIENVNFLNTLPISLLGKLVNFLKAEVYLVNDVIMEVNKTGNCMYFIASGTVAVYNEIGKEVYHLRDGAHFGEMAIIIPNALRIASVVAVESCKLYRLERADFSKIIHPYPLLWEKIKKNAIKWHEKKARASID